MYDIASESVIKVTCSLSNSSSAAFGVLRECFPGIRIASYIVGLSYSSCCMLNTADWCRSDI
jgi:hypothetical protein